MANPLHLKDIARELRRLQQSSPVSPDGLASWFVAGQQFVKWQRSACPEVKLPPHVMHYLHDADIRLRDPEYRKEQDRVLAEFIASLEQGIVPESSGRTIVLRTRWLVAASLLILAAVITIVR